MLGRVAVGSWVQTESATMLCVCVHRHAVCWGLGALRGRNAPTAAAAAGLNAPPQPFLLLHPCALQGCFNMTQVDAARHLGFGSSTVLKKVRLAAMPGRLLAEGVGVPTGC